MLPTFVGGALVFTGLAYNILNLEVIMRKPRQWGLLGAQVGLISCVGLLGAYWAAKFASRNLIQCLVDVEDKTSEMYRTVRKVYVFVFLVRFLTD